MTMRITLIKPNIGIRAYSGQADNASMEPLQLGVLAALTPPISKSKCMTTGWNPSHSMSRPT